MDRKLNAQIKSNLKQNWVTPSKWILAGEHSVLRGGEALVFPLFSKSMTWSFLANQEPLKIEFSGETSQELEMIFGFVLEKACDAFGIDRQVLKGHLQIDSEILFGMGLGASASLAVGLAKLFKASVPGDFDELQFAQKIENFFHGESSGVDVAVVFHQKPLIFRRSAPPQMIDQYLLPKLTLSHCGRRGPTKDCVEKVKTLFTTNPSLAAQVDLRMNESVQIFKKLMIDGPQEAWIQTIQQAHSCFEDWDLVPTEAKEHIKFLKSSGALACKMTGSGGGGYILSLWDHSCDFEKIKTIIPLDQSSRNS
jgi:mevalonate kinase